MSTQREKDDARDFAWAKRLNEEGHNWLPIGDLRALLTKGRKEKRKAVTCWGCEAHRSTDVHHRDGNHSNNAPSNLICWCKRCHNEYHGIDDRLNQLGLLVKTFLAIQKNRIEAGNRVHAYTDLGYPVETLARTAHELRDLEDRVVLDVKEFVKDVPVYKFYLKRIKGVAHTIGGLLISIIVDPGRFMNPSKLNAYVGLHLKNGKAVQKRKGEVANWHQLGRAVLTRRLIDSFARMKHYDPQPLGTRLYYEARELYREKKRTESDWEDASDDRIDKAARRKVAKIFLQCLWEAWRRINGLSTVSPYAALFPQHTRLVTPEDWAGEGWYEDYVAATGQAEPEVLPDDEFKTKRGKKAGKRQVLVEETGELVPADD